MQNCKLKINRTNFIILTILLIMTVLLITTLLSEDMNWGLFDFIVTGVLLSGVGFSFELTARLTKNSAYRAGMALASIAIFALIWINLAVGIIGSEDNRANVMYGVVPLVGFFGAILAGFRPLGMAKSSYAMAAVQATVPFFAMTINKLKITSVDEFLGVLGVLILNSFFVFLFLVCGFLFKCAEKPEHQ